MKADGPKEYAVSGVTGFLTGVVLVPVLHALCGLLAQVCGLLFVVTPVVLAMWLYAWIIN